MHVVAKLTEAAKILENTGYYAMMLGCVHAQAAIAYAYGGRTRTRRSHTQAAVAHAYACCGRIRRSFTSTPRSAWRHTKNDASGSATNTAKFAAF